MSFESPFKGTNGIRILKEVQIHSFKVSLTQCVQDKLIVRPGGLRFRESKLD